MGIGGILRYGLFAGTLAGVLAVAGCGDTGTSSVVRGPIRASQPTAEDVEAPKVFSAQEAGLWDGRPSLGGVWVAYPGVKNPERVLIRNTTNDRAVVGALFRRERSNPGPKLQVSADAAEELGMLAGAPTRLSVVALKRGEPSASAATPDTAKPDAAKPDAGATAKSEPAKPAPAPKAATPAPAGSAHVQIGTFGVEENATRAAARLRSGGLPAVVRTGTSRGKPTWSVLAGPGNAADLMQKTKALGFADAYVTK